MNIILLNQFYPPDHAPTGWYLHDLATFLVRRGHRVTVIASQRSYQGGGDYLAHEVLDGVQVVRVPAVGFGRKQVWTRIADYASYLVFAAFRVMRQPFAPQLILACTTPPFLGLVARLAAAMRGSRHAHWVMDLYPDALVSAGMVGRNSLAWKLLSGMARRQWSGGGVMSIGPCMSERIQAHHDGSTPWIPLWVRATARQDPDPAKVLNLRRERGWNDGRLVIGYAGNLGAGHDIETLIASMYSLGPDGPRWVFSGSGNRRLMIENLMRTRPDLPVQVLPYVSDEMLPIHLAAIDVHLVSLAAGWEGVIVPSKLQAAFASGRPVIVIASAASEPARWTKSTGAGWVVEPGNIAGLIASLQQAKDPLLRATMGARAKRAAQRWFAPVRSLTLFADWIEQGTSTPRSINPVKEST